MRYFIFISLLFCSFFNAAGTGGGDGKFDFWIGFKGGINFSTVIPAKRFSVLQPSGGMEPTAGRKNYKPFYRNPGYQYGFVGLVRITRSLLIGIEPTFSSYTFKYTSFLQWTDAANPGNRLEIESNFTDRLKYFEIPLEIRYELGSGQIRPFLAGGFFYSLLTGANGNISSVTTQYINETGIELDNNSTTGENSGSYIKTRLAAFPGAGFFADLSWVTLFAEADYFISLHNIVNESKRYSNQQNAGGSYNVPDNLVFNNLVINVGVLFNINQNLKSGGGGKGKGSAVPCPVFKSKR
ncbi:MAG TPA: hypothetical protein VK179_15915 [Bacteroidales bacterium]|nr:hypothetical protein [Bacteroidales bacterium]